jgi:hypothetical protein
MVVVLACLSTFAAAVLATVVSRARHRGRCIVARDRSEPRPSPIHFPLLVALASLVVVGPPGTLFFALLPPVQSLFADLACPTGSSVVSASTDIGASTTYGAMCQVGGELQPLRGIYYGACASLVVGLVSAIGLILLCNRWLVERRRVRFSG